MMGRRGPVAVVRPRVVAVTQPDNSPVETFSKLMDAIISGEVPLPTYQIIQTNDTFETIWGRLIET